METNETCVARRLGHAELREIAKRTGQDYVSLSRENKDYLISKGLCPTCGKRPPKPERKSCANCLEVSARAHRRYYEANRAERRAYNRDYYFNARRKPKLNTCQPLTPEQELERAKAELAKRQSEAS